MRRRSGYNAPLSDADTEREMYGLPPHQTRRTLSSLSALAPNRQPAGRRFPKLRYVAVFIVCGWALYHYWHVQHPQLAQLQRQQQQLQTEVATMQQRHVALQREITEFHDNSFIARYASQHFGLYLPGQVSFTVRH